MDKLHAATSRWAASWEDKRARRNARKQLERELATYTSPAEVAELEAMLDRHTPSESAEIRRILARRPIAC
jgi:hypothetical protein